MRAVCVSSMTSSIARRHTYKVFNFSSIYRHEISKFVWFFTLIEMNCNLNVIINGDRSYGEAKSLINT